MLKQFPPLSSTRYSQLIKSSSTLGVLISLVLFNSGSWSRPAQANPVTAATVLADTALMAQTATLNRFDNGVYLYGQAPTADQIGSAYLVFETRNDQFIGAFYMPHSSFDCVHGSITANQLEMTVISSYGEGEYPYAVALTDTDAIAGLNPTERELGLAGFNAIPTLSETDHQVLATCISNYEEQVW